MPTNPRSLPFLLNISVLTGCAVGPDYTPPETALSARFLGQEGVEEVRVRTRPTLVGAGRSMCLVAYGEDGKRHARSMWHLKRVTSRQGWP